MKLRVGCAAVVLGCTSPGWWLEGCGGGGSASSRDAGGNSATDSGTALDSSSTHSGAASAADGAPAANNLQIVTTNGSALRGGPGDALNLGVVLILVDGGTVPVPADQITWTAPETVIAQDPSNAGPNGVLPASGVRPTAFFVNNPYSGQYGPGALFVADPGTAIDAGIQVIASVTDAGEVSAWIAISPAIDGGDPVRGQRLFDGIALADNLTCGSCHGMTAAGSPSINEGDAGPSYELPSTNGSLYPYPAPSLNETSSPAGPNLAADPTWNAGLLGVAIQADIDNQGVALRGPMPDFFLVPTGDVGSTLNSQDVADIYAWLRTQTH
jgi:Cytochrome c